MTKLTGVKHRISTRNIITLFKTEILLYFQIAKSEETDFK